MPTKKPLFKLVLKDCDLPLKQNFDEELRFLCQSLGFFEEIDKEKTAFSIFKEIICASEKGSPLSSTELAKHVKMSRGSVIHHLNNLQRSGLIIKQGRYYFPRARSVYLIMKELRYDLENIFRRLELISKKIDSELGLEVDEL